jgi:acetamidase/formamidase
MTRDDIYMLASVSADLPIARKVDGNKGVHRILSKAILTKAR